ncbi:Crp/Fnr family transcriptional regulator [Pedobacter sp. Du54]|uniref:Crp/Fnr family transcriptional regulator n=1 Tax=Pedobacter anseongensis TaxID=3133439 RepID=UPI0030B3A257
MENIQPVVDLMQVLGQITPLPAPFQQRMLEQVIEEQFPAKHTLLAPGDTCKRIYFVKLGFLRAYHLDPNGNEHTTWFMGQNDIVISVHSFFTQQPAHEYVEILQDSILQSISWHQLQSYYADFPQGNLLGRIVTEKYYIQSEERALFLRIQSPEERYQALLNRHPDIFLHTTTQNIASYLNMRRETLSKLRSRLAKNH